MKHHVHVPDRSDLHIGDPVHISIVRDTPDGFDSQAVEGRVTAGVLLIGVGQFAVVTYDDGMLPDA